MTCRLSQSSARKMKALLVFCPLMPVG